MVFLEIASVHLRGWKKQSSATIPEDRVLDLIGLPFPPTADDLIPTDAENDKRSVGRLVSGLNGSGALSQPLLPQTMSSL